MGYFAHVAGRSDVPLWSLSSEERIRRQLRQAGDITAVSDLDSIPDDDGVLLLRADFLYEARTLTSLLERPGSAHSRRLHCL